jgi:HEPN domain-containing protein
LIFLAKKLAVPSPIFDCCVRLNKVYVETRYPDTDGIIPAKRFSEEEVNAYFQLADQVLKWLEQNL